MLMVYDVSWKEIPVNLVTGRCIAKRTTVAALRAIHTVIFVQMETEI